MDMGYFSFVVLKERSAIEGEARVDVCVADRAIADTPN
tara:strand:+ start:229 stop:342 length:114 start_codon:yes stop_codon:yes gene_type:complete